MKKALTLLLAAALLLTLPVFAFAAGPAYDYVVINGTGVSEGGQYTVGDGTATWDPDTATLTLDNIDATSWFGIAPTDDTITVNVVFKGENTITGSGTVLFADANLSMRGEDGASLTITSSGGGNAVWATNKLLINEGTYSLNANDYPATAGAVGVEISNGANLVSVSASGSSVYSEGYLTVSGSDTSVTADGYYCGFIAKGGDITFDGATVSASSEADHIVYTATGSIILNNADVTLTSEYESGSGLVMFKEDGSVSITNSSVNVDVESTAIFSVNSMDITDSVLDITSGGNALNARNGDIVIDGADTDINASCSFPMNGANVYIRDGSVNVHATDGTAISADHDISITGGDTTATTDAAMSAIYSLGGDILFDGINTSVDAASALDSAVFTRNGTLTLNAGDITATAAEGFAAFVARFSGQSDNSVKPENLIIIGENFNAGDSIVATTVWKDNGEDGYYADTMIVSSGTVLDDGLLPEDYSPTQNVVTIEVNPADYTEVDAAIAAAQALVKEDYVDFSGVEAAIAAVVRGKNITEQAEVDAMAKAIEEAIADLEYKPADYTAVDAAIAAAQALVKEDYVDFSGVEAAINAVVRDKNITEQAEVDAMADAIYAAMDALVEKTDGAESDTSETPEPPVTGDIDVLIWVSILVVSAALAFAARKKVR